MKKPLKSLKKENNPSLKKITVFYYALLREQRGKHQETLYTPAATLEDLFKELQNRHGFTMGKSLLRVAVNEGFASWGQKIKHNDAVVFIPPVAGG